MWPRSVLGSRSIGTIARGWTTERVQSVDMPKMGSSKGDSIEELERLQSLHKSGGLTDEEFAAAKKKLLDS